MIRTKLKRFLQYILLLILVLGLLVVAIAYLAREREGLVTERYPRDFYRMPKLFVDGQKNPEFIFCGDTQPGWRIKEKFLKRENWFTWKMFIFPFYEVYWLGNGVVGGVSYLQHKPDYGDRERQIVRDAVYAQASQPGVDFILHAGDMTDNGRRPSDWAIFLRENKADLPLVSSFPFLPVAGNHDRANDPIYGLPNYEAVFDHPRFYVLDFPDMAIFMVDSNVILDQYQYIDDDKQDALFQEWFVSAEGSERPSWLERELSSRSQRFKILVMHHPPVSFGRHHTDWTKPTWGRNLPQKRQKLLKLLHEQGVQILLCGHEHIYEHSIVRYHSTENQEENEIHIVVSSSGAPLRRRSDVQKVEKFRQDYHDEGLDVSLVKQEEINHYCLVSADSDGITIQVLEAIGDKTQPVRLADEILLAE
jgi:3',5'-cyclic AMP phosphodiesterase CpdA